MKLKHLCSARPCGCNQARRKVAHTLIELLVAAGIGTVVIAGAMAFLLYGTKSISGVTNQTRINAEASTALAFMQSRIRFATLVSNDSSGDILTLGFDSNYAVDSGNGGGGVAWANQDYFSQFKFVGVNTTNLPASAANQLIYIPDTRNTANKVLIHSGVRNLPGHNIFFVTNSVLTSICYGVVDVNPRDYYEAIEIQAMAASLNRPATKPMVTILPAP